MGDIQIDLWELVCPWDKVGMDFSGFLFWKRTDLGVFKLL